MRTAGWRAVLGGVPGRLLVTALVLILALDCRPSQAGPPGQSAPPAAPAQPEKVARRSIQVPGTVQAAEQASLYAGATGYVAKVSIDIGDRVKKGDMLAQLAVPDVEAGLKQKMAGIAQAEAEIDQAHAALKVAEAARAAAAAGVAQAQAAVQAAEANLKFRKAEADRLKGLGQQKSVDQAVVEEALRQADAAAAALKQAQAQLEAARAATQGAEANRVQAEAAVKVAQARLEVSRADVEQVRALLEYATIRAPFDGVITRRGATVGTLEGPSLTPRDQPLFVVSRIDSVRVVVAVPEAAAAEVGPGTRAVVRLDALRGRPLEGKVARTAGALDPQAHTLRAEIDLPNPDGKLLPGMSGTVTIATEQEK